jgi:hypothetical protein
MYLFAILFCSITCELNVCADMSRCTHLLNLCICYHLFVFLIVIWLVIVSLSNLCFNVRTERQLLMWPQAEPQLYLGITRLMTSNSLKCKVFISFTVLPSMGRIWQIFEPALWSRWGQWGISLNLKFLSVFNQIYKNVMMSQTVQGSVKDQFAGDPRILDSRNEVSHY